jgi:hypothetical protein
MASEISEQIVREAPDIEAYKLGLLKSAQALQMPTLPNYQVAGLQQQQLDALRSGAQGIGAYQPYLQQGTATLGAGAGTVGQGIASLYGATGGYDPRMGMAFMNPYMQSVIDQSLQEINRQGDLSRQNLQAQAVRAGAFGGSREGVQRAELERGLSQTRNQAITSALQSGYGAAQQQAQQAFEQQQQRQLAMGQGLGSLGTQLGTMGIQQAALGQTAQGLGQNDVNFQFNLGSIQQKQQQAELDALRASQMQQAMQPYQQLAFVSDIYKGAPSTQMSVTQQQQAAPSPFQQVVGLGTAALAVASAFGGGGSNSSSNKTSLF